jgi:hypothetical protein
MGEDDEQPPPQSEPLRQQQRSVALGGSILAGLAVMVGFIQRFPDVALAGVLAGVVSGVVVYRLAVASVFPGEESTTPEAAKDDEEAAGEGPDQAPSNASGPIDDEVPTPNSEGDEAATTNSEGDEAAMKDSDEDESVTADSGSDDESATSNSSNNRER